MIKTKNIKKNGGRSGDRTCLACACAGFLQMSVEERGRQVLDN
jgi:hypothetical protein